MSASQLLVKAEVESGFVDSRGGIGRNGKPYEIHEQKVWFYLGSKFPKEVSMPLNGPADAYPVGLYVADLLPALGVGDFERLGIDMRKVRLVSAESVGAPKLAPAARAAG